MSIYHLHASLISRSSGKSALASAAYRSGEKLHDERVGETFDYRRKSGILDKGIETPEGAPSWAKDRGRLWNAAEKAETRTNSRVAREIRVALPSEFPLSMNRKILKDFISKSFIEKGMAADWAIHAPSLSGDDRNTHAHIMLTVRRFGQNGFAEKDRNWDKVSTLIEWRKSWAEVVNTHLKQYGMSDKVIDHRTLKAQGIDREPTTHIGYSTKSIDRKIERLGRALQAISPKKEIKIDNQDNNKERRIDLEEYERQLVERYYPGDRDISKKEVKKNQDRDTSNRNDKIDRGR